MQIKDRVPIDANIVMCNKLIYLFFSFNATYVVHLTMHSTRANTSHILTKRATEFLMPKLNLSYK